MLNNLRAAILVPDIRKRIGFVLGAFALFVFMIHVQIPNVNVEVWGALLQQGTFYNFLGFLSGGALQRLSIIAMGITPYINASIIMQLMTVVLPQLEEMAKKGGEEGRKRISQYTRWLTIVLALVQATTMSIAMRNSGVFYDHSIFFLIYVILSMVAGTMFLMWLGEQITDKGIGNGVSLIIFIGIVLRYPTYVSQTVQLGQKSGLNYFGLILFIAIALVTIVSIIFMYQGQRRVPVQQARRVVGRKMFAGRSSYIPLRLNNAGVISIIFAISILLLAATGAVVVPPCRGDRLEGDGGALRPDVLQSEHAALQPRILRPGRHLHVLLQRRRRQHARHRRQPEEERLVHPRHPAGPADGRLSQPHLAAPDDGLGRLPRPARRAAVDAAARARRDDVLPRLDLAADRRRCRARHDDADRGAPRDA